MARASAMDPDERRAAILAAARRVFVRKGYHRAGVADIVQEVGVARGTFYRYFEGKREVFAAVLGGVMDEVVGVVRPIDVTRPIPEQIDGLEVETNRGRHEIIRPSLSAFALSSRGNKGRWVIKSGHLVRSHRPPFEVRVED